MENTTMIKIEHHKYQYDQELWIHFIDESVKKRLLNKLTKAGFEKWSESHVIKGKDSICMHVWNSDADSKKGRAAIMMLKLTIAEYQTYEMKTTENYSQKELD
jgi:hypothetical protein